MNESDKKEKNIRNDVRKAKCFSDLLEVRPARKGVIEWRSILNKNGQNSSEKGLKETNLKPHVRKMKKWKRKEVDFSVQRSIDSFFHRKEVGEQIPTNGKRKCHELNDSFDFTAANTPQSKFLRRGDSTTNGV